MFDEKSQVFEFGELQNNANRADLDNCSRMSLFNCFLQRSASIQPRADPETFAV